MVRTVHFVGSIPADDADQAMRFAMERAAPHLRSITDGETGERYNWVANIVDGFREHPDFKLVQQGQWSSYKDAPRLKVRRGHRLDPSRLEFGHDTAALAALPRFRELRAERGLENLSFQVGIPGDLDMALFTFGPHGAFRYRGVFREVLGREMRRIHATGGNDILFQVEIPAELVFLCRTPSPLRPAMAAFLANGITRLISEAPPDARFGVHLCLGDLNHKGLGKLKNAEPFVILGNALIKRWPAGRKLDYLHAPFTSGTETTPTAPEFYAPLADLNLPEGTRFIAGLVQETSSIGDLQGALQLTERALGREVDLAAPCGLGRRTFDQATANTKLACQLRD